MQKTNEQNKEHQQMEDNNFLKRGKGKVTGNVKKSEFYSYYIKNAKEKIVDRAIYNSFVKELLDTLSTEVVTTGLELKINKVGKLRIRSKELHFFKKDGTMAKSLRIDWKASWDFWAVKYPELSREEIVKIKNKTVIYHENEHTNGEFYEHFWDKYSTVLKFKSFYNFKASRQYSRLIAKVVKDPNRKTFYYG